MGPVVQHLTNYAPDEITLLVYPEGASSFTLYEDDGETNAYRNGRFALSEITSAELADELVLRVAAVVGDVDVLPVPRTYSFQVYTTDAPKSVLVDGGAGEWWRDGRFLFVAAGRAPSEVRVTW